MLHGAGTTHAMAPGLTVAVAGLWTPTLLPRFHDDPWSHRAPEDEVQPPALRFGKSSGAAFVLAADL